MKYGITNGVIASRMSGVWTEWRTPILMGGAICVVFLGAAGIISEREEDRQIVALEKLRVELEQREREFRVDVVETNWDLREFVGKQADVLGTWKEETMPRPWMEIIEVAIGRGIEKVSFETETRDFEKILYRGRIIERRREELKEEQAKLERRGVELERRDVKLEEEQAKLERREGGT